MMADKASLAIGNQTQQSTPDFSSDLFVTKTVREWKESIVAEREELYSKMPHEMKTQQDILDELTLMFERQDGELS